MADNKRKVTHLSVDPLTLERFTHHSKHHFVGALNTVKRCARCSTPKELLAKLKCEGSLPVKLNTLLYVLHAVCNKNPNAMELC